MKKVLIFGSRGFKDYAYVHEKLDFYINEPVIVIEGEAPGIDQLARRWAKEHGMECLPRLAEWFKYGKGAGFIRNTEMVEECDIAIGFWDGKSPGTKDTISKLIKKNKIVIIINIK